MMLWETNLFLYRQNNKMHFLYVFILQFLYNSTCFERPFRSSSGVHMFTVFCGPVQTMRMCLTDRSYGWSFETYRVVQKL